MTRRTLRRKAARAALFKRYNGKCAICSKPLDQSWHADHIIPWVISRQTNPHLMQPLCPSCNLKKGSKTNYQGDQK